MAVVTTDQIQSAWEAGELDTPKQIIEWLLNLGVRVVRG